MKTTADRGPGRVMGLDFGAKTVGVALSDPLGITAQRLETVHRERENKLRRTYARLEEIITENNVEEIVLGLPLLMNGSEGERARLTREFGETLSRRTGLNVVYRDERLTTVEAERTLEAMGVKAADRKTHSDELAAVLILQGYLESRG